MLFLWDLLHPLSDKGSKGTVILTKLSTPKEVCLEQVLYPVSLCVVDKT